MRKAHDLQMQFGETPISEIKIDLNSRDDIPPLLLGLQYIYTTPKLREKVFQILKENIASETDHNNGRPGMELWKIFVLGVLRVNLSWDYDRLGEMVNNHKVIRQMLGHGLLDDDYAYKLQTLKDNVYLLTPELLEEINTVVVQTGHDLFKKKDESELNGRCDSFVVETDVHYPTDINLLYDAMRKIITLVSALSAASGLNGWRQSSHNIKMVKRAFRKAQQLKRSTSKKSDKKEKRKQLIIQAHQAYIDMSHKFLNKAEQSLDQVSAVSPFSFVRILETKIWVYPDLSKLKV